MKYRITATFSPEFLRLAAQLYRIAGWVEEDDGCEFLAAALKNSCAVCAAFADDGKLIGMGRALGDGVRTLVAELRSRGVDWIGLVGEPGTEEFYRSLGFRAPAGFTFWRLG